MNFICKCLGGSRMYGLSTPKSDVDYRGVYLDDKIENIIGLGKNEVTDIKVEGDDHCYFELRHFIRLLSKTNTNSIELLFNKNWITTSPLFKFIQENKNNLIDPHYLFNSLKGYMYGERRLALGERTGDLGGKRKNAIDEYGYSPKNVSHMFRLANAGISFFQTGEFTVNFQDTQLGDFLKKIKVAEIKFTKEEIESYFQKLIIDLNCAYESSSILGNFKFDRKFANNIILKGYFEILKDSYSAMF